MKEIPGYPGYSATTDGKIWSGPGHRKHKKGKFLKPGPSSNSEHLHVVLRKDGMSINKFVHRLILETFIGPCPDRMECRHLDGDPLNNNLDNLCWGTKRDNFLDAVKHGVRKQDCQYKLTEQDVRLVVYLYRTKLFSQKEIANIYNVDPSNVSHIINKDCWKHIWN